MDNEAQPVLGLARGGVRLHDHEEAWSKLYLREADLIKAAVGDGLVDIRHYGSTAMPAIKAKPILDILAGVAALDAALDFIEPLAKLGYEYCPEVDIPGHHIFSKGSPQTHLLHFVEYAGPAWDDALVFYSALCDSPELAHKYETLKMELAERFSDSRPDYTTSKAEFIERVIAG